jgi:hypothetical protein
LHGIGAGGGDPADVHFEVDERWIGLAQEDVESAASGEGGELEVMVVIRQLQT